MRRTAHILDVISRVSMSSKCTKIVGGLGFAYSASPDRLAGFKEPTSKAPTSKGKERRGWDGDRGEERAGAPK